MHNMGYRGLIGVFIAAVAVQSAAASGAGLNYLRTVAAPSNLRITGGSECSVDLAWNDNSGNESGFQIYMRPAGGSWSLFVTLPANTTHVHLSGGCGTSGQYDFKVRALGNSSGAWPLLPSSFSNVVAKQYWCGPC